MDREYVLDIIKKVIGNVLNLKEDYKSLNEDSNLYDDLGIDSVDSIDIIIALEAEFNITILDADKKFMESINTIATKVLEMSNNK